MKAWLPGLVVMLALDSAATTGREGIVGEDELRERAAEALLIVAPEYPKDLVAAGVQGTVDLFGHVRADGHFDVGRIEATHPELRRAVEEVTRHWLLRPSYGPDCEARPAPVQVRLWFEVKSGKGVVSMSQGRTAIRADTTRVPRKQLKRIEGDDPFYPKHLIRRALEGEVEALMRITPAGEVASVQILPGPFAQEFGPALRETLLEWRFEARAPDASPVCYFFHARYRLVD